MQVGEALQSIASAAVHKVVARIRGLEVKALSGVGANGLGAKTNHVAIFN